MHKNEEDTVEELWASGVTAQYLAEQLPNRTANGWDLWLRNNRNQSRPSAYRIPIVRISNGSFYQPAEVHKFVDWEKSKQVGTIKLSGRSLEVMKALGVDTPGGSTTGRKLKVKGITRQTDRSTNETYVQFVVEDPFLVFRLSIEEARLIAEQLNGATLDAHA